MSGWNDLHVASRPAAFAAEDTGADVGDTVEEGCGESFTAGTRVLLAPGAAIPISRLQPGDRVLANNVKAGKTQAEPATAVMVKRDTNRYDLTIELRRETWSSTPPATTAGTSLNIECPALVLTDAAASMPLCFAQILADLAQQSGKAFAQ